MSLNATRHTQIVIHRYSLSEHGQTLKRREYRWLIVWSSSAPILLSATGAKQACPREKAKSTKESLVMDDRCLGDGSLHYCSSAWHRVGLRRAATAISTLAWHGHPARCESSVEVRAFGFPTFPSPRSEEQGSYRGDNSQKRFTSAPVLMYLGVVSHILHGAKRRTRVPYV